MVLQFLVPYAPWIALALILLAGFATVRNGLAGASSLGFIWFGVLIFLVALYLGLSGYIFYAFLTGLLAGLVVIADGFHERRVNRRAWARMKG